MGIKLIVPRLCKFEVFHHQAFSCLSPNLSAVYLPHIVYSPGHRPRTALLLIPNLFHKQKESGLPNSQGDSHSSPPCQTTSRVLIEHSVNNTSFTAQKAAILRHPHLRTLSISLVSNVRATTRVRHIASAKVSRHSLPSRHRQRTRMPAAPFRNQKIQLNLSKTASQATATTFPIPL